MTPYIGRQPYFGWHGVYDLDATMHRQNFIGSGSYLFGYSNTASVWAYDTSIVGANMIKWNGMNKATYGCVPLNTKSLAIDPKGRFLIVCGNASASYYQMYETKEFGLPNIATKKKLQTAPSSQFNGMAFNAAGTYFSVAGNGATAYVYAVQSTLDSTWTDVASKTFTGTNPQGVAFSPNGTWWAVTGGKDTSTNEYLKVYLTSDWSQIAEMTQPAGIGIAVTFSPDSALCAVAHYTTPYLTVYNTTTSPWTKLSDVSTPPTGNGSGVNFNPAGTYLIVSHATTPFHSIYKVSDWSKIASPFSTAPTLAGCSQYSPDGTMLAIGNTTQAGPVYLYDISGETYTLRSHPTDFPYQQAISCAWMQLGNNPLSRIA